MNNNFLWFVLSNVKGVGNKILLDIFEKNKLFNLTINDFLNLSTSEIKQKYNLNPQIIQSIINIKHHTVNIKEVYNQVIQKGIRIITLENEEYPNQLKQIKPLPFIIYYYGNIELLKKNNVAICGSRNISLEGLDLVYKFSQVLLNQKICIIRGDTTKTDTLEYLAKLQLEQGNEIIVLSEGILSFLKMIQKINKKIDTNQQLILSFVKPLLHWTVYAEKEKNKIIFNLASIIIIVEARHKGIIMNEALKALKMNKKVFVVKYTTYPVSATANEKLIEAGAIPIESEKWEQVYKLIIS